MFEYAKYKDMNFAISVYNRNKKFIGVFYSYDYRKLKSVAKEKFLLDKGSTLNVFYVNDNKELEYKFTLTIFKTNKI